MKRRQITVERLESRQLMASDWQNATLIRDVNGQTLANSIVTLSLDGSATVPGTVVADADGRFTVDLAVAEGLQTVRLSARDDLGRQSDKTLEVRRGNTIQDWNASALDIARQ